MKREERKMRDPKRIKRICRLLEKKWAEAPDQRLGQFLSNFVFGHHVDIFHQEDNVTEKALGLLEKIKLGEDDG